MRFDKQKIVFLVSSMQVGGAERVAAVLSNSWVSRGHDVTLVVTYSGRGECCFPLDCRVQLVYLADFVKNSRVRIKGYMDRFWALRRLITDRSPTVVISFMDKVNVIAVLATVGLSVPAVVSERIHPPCYPRGMLWENLRRLTYPLAARVVMQTNESLLWLKRVIPSARGVIIPNPIEFPLPAGSPYLDVARNVSVCRKLLLAVGRLDPQKGFDLLIDAFSRLASAHVDWDLAILGEGYEREQLQARITRLGLKDRIRLYGRVGNIGDWYKRSDLFVMSSRFEGFPNALVEAMASGCAVVSYDCDTGPSDIIHDGKDGILVWPAGDVAALMNKLDWLMRDDVQRNAMRGAAAGIRERLSVEKIADAWDALLLAVSVEKVEHTK